MYTLFKLTALFCLLTSLATATEPTGAPILRLETGMHTARINGISVDVQERFLLTASNDKTLRLWDLTTGELRTPIYRVPIGAGNEGRLDAGAISPDGELIAGGGWTGFSWETGGSIYLFNRGTGKLIKRLYGLPDVIFHLCFSPDGQYLAASLGRQGGIRIWETQRWEQVFGDAQYGDNSMSCQFDSQHRYRLLTTSYDGHLRL
jgi:WD40 repeat protein